MCDAYTIVATEPLASPVVEWLAARCRLVVADIGAVPIPGPLAEADGLIVRTYTAVNADLLARAPRLRVVGRAGAGLDNIDVAACRARGIEVVYTPDANTQAVVEYVICLILDALRPRIDVSRAVDPSTWNRMRAETVGHRQMSELTLGILGLGRIGRRIAEVAHSLGCTVLYNDLLSVPPTLRGQARSVPVEELFARSDALTIHIDGRPNNRHFISKRLIESMKKNVLFLNTSRGFVVDKMALSRFLAAQPSAQAVLDVHEPEPIDAAYPLLGLPNARLLPHLASRTETALLNMSWVARDVLAVLEGREAQFQAP